MDKSGGKIKYKGFENLEIWKGAKQLFVELSKTFYKQSFRNYSFQDQIMRAAISISNNIAEGFERGSNKEFVRFLYIAKGSCGEVRSMLYLAEEMNYLSQKEVESLNRQCIIISVKIHNFIAYLKKSS